VKKMEKQKRFSPRCKVRKASKGFLLRDSTSLCSFAKNLLFFSHFLTLGGEKFEGEV